MELRFNRDPDTGLPHIYGHGIKEHEVEEVLRRPGQEIAGNANSKLKVGQTAAGRFLRVIYSPDDDGEGVFVITAYELRAKAKRALKRRRRKGQT